jgi:hypothetical protein
MVMSSDVVTRKVTNPRWRACSQTLVPDEDYDYDAYVPTFQREPEDVPVTLSWSRRLFDSWRKPLSSSNRVVEPVLKNSEGKLVGLNRPVLEEDSLLPWR